MVNNVISYQGNLSAY